MRAPARTAAAALALLALAGSARAIPEIPARPPDATLDLATTAGLGAARGEWRYGDAQIVTADFKGPGLDGKPTGAPIKTYDVSPRAGAKDFDDSRWEVIDPTTLVKRRSTGKICFAWYRLRFTVPETIGGFSTIGSTVVFETVVDDYAEVWVDGELPRRLGQVGGSLAAGWNAPNRLVVARDARPGRTVQIAVFAMNGPVSAAPENFIWMRSARLDFYAPEGGHAPRAVAADVLRLDPAIDAIVPKDAAFEKLAEGFTFTEGPLWVPDGYLLFSDPNENRIYQWSPRGTLAIFRDRSGYAGVDIAEYGQPGSNGLAFDAQGRLTICEHGNRRVTRLENDGSLTVLADRYEGKRLNSPNDLVYRSDGTLYFTDPPFGLPKFHDDPRRELSVTGVYCLAGDRLRLVSADLAGPNGLAFSPDERYLYVTNWDVAKKVVMRYEVNRDGSLKNGRIFYDMTREEGEIALDGLKVDREGNVYVSGPGGLWVLSPKGRHLGTIRLPELPANFAWGDADGKTLYMTARSGLYRVRLNVAGAPRGSRAKEAASR